MGSFFLLSATAASAQNTSFTEAGYGLQASNYLNSLLVASPPLPMLVMKTGTSRYSIQPGYIEGKLDALDPSTSTSRTRGQVFGGGGAFGFNHAYTDSVGVYVLAFGNKAGGEFSVVQETGCSPTCIRTDMRDIASSFIAAGVGINWTFIGGAPTSVFSAGLFAGPAMTMVNMSQKVVRTDGATVTDDFEMKLSPSFVTALFGLQMGFRVGDWVTINPYLMANWVFNDQCQTYEVTKVNVAGSLAGRSTSTCGGSSNGSPATTTHQIEMKGDVSAIGVNVGLSKIGAALNLYSMPSVPYKGSVLGSMKTSTFILTLALETN